MRVVIAEDHVLLRDGLTRLLAAYGHDVVAAVGTADALIAALEAEPVDLAVVDVRMPPTHTTEGLVAALEIRSRHPATPILVLSQYVEQMYARQLMRAGVGGIGYLLKDRVADIESFIDAIERVAAGGTVLDPLVVARLLAHASRQEPMTRLTPREREVLALMAEGRSNAAIAAAMVVTEKAVGKHITNIFMKLDLPTDSDDNRRVLAVLAYLQSD